MNFYLKENYYHSPFQSMLFGNKCYNNIFNLRNLMRKHKAAYITAIKDCNSHCSLRAEVRRNPHSEARTVTREAKLEATIL